MNHQKPTRGFNRRDFFRTAIAGGLGAAMLPAQAGDALSECAMPLKPATNIGDALKYPRNEWSLPGKFPGKVASIIHRKCVDHGKPVTEAVSAMLTAALLVLTGESDIQKAWSHFVAPGEKIGLKVNPIGGKLLSTSHALVHSVIEQLIASGIPIGDIVIWDRREFQLHDAGFTPEEYPGIRIAGTEIRDENGSFYNIDGILYSEEMIDKDWYYWADVEGEYDAYTLPYMVNSGKYSYFSKICTQELDKIINLPILKNAGSSITLCLKNLGYGVITNTGRLHKELWGETSAEVCCFPPVRDKVVLNIADGIIGCYQGGPGANPQYICNYNALLAGTDPVAVDRIGYEMVLARRISEGVQQEDIPRSREFMHYADRLGLGISTLDKIELIQKQL